VCGQVARDERHYTLTTRGDHRPPADTRGLFPSEGQCGVRQSFLSSSLITRNGTLQFLQIRFRDFNKFLQGLLHIVSPAPSVHGPRTPATEKQAICKR